MSIRHIAVNPALAPRRGQFRGAQLRGAFGLALGSGLLIACSEGLTGPSPVNPSTTVRWNALARELVISDRVSPPMASRAYAYLSVAQYASALAAYGVRPDAIPGLAAIRGVHAPMSAAIASASARILTAMFPAHAHRIEEELRADLAGLREQSVEVAAIERGAALSVDIAAALEIRAGLDGWSTAWGGTLPNGPGYWTGTAPQHPNWGLVRPWLWESGSQLRAPPPPAFDSQEFRNAVAEVRQIAENRTAEQMEIARHWADGAGTYTPPGHWNEIAAQLIGASGMGELQAARTFALMNIAMADALIGCWDSKYTYWLIRPYQADPAITTPIGQPPHPSYPSGHACSSGAGARVLALVFPSEGNDLERMSVEACDSRVYAGIHYRFDAEAGMTIGTRAGERALERGDQLIRAEIGRALARANE